MVSTLDHDGGHCYDVGYVGSGNAVKDFRN